MTSNKNKVAFLVISFDGFSDLWPECTSRINILFNGLTKKFILTNYKNFDQNGFKNISVGKDKSWSSNLIKALKMIKEPYVLLWLDDVFLESLRNEFSLDNLINFMEEHDATLINLKANPLPFWKKLGSTRYIRISGPLLYKSAVAPVLWNRERLLNLLNENEDAWQFELNGSDRLASDNRVFILNKNPFTYIHVLIKGKLLFLTALRLKKSNFFAIEKFDVMSIGDHTALYLRKFISLCLRQLPFNLRGKLRKKFKS